MKRLAMVSVLALVAATSVGCSKKKKVTEKPSGPVISDSAGKAPPGGSIKPDPGAVPAAPGAAGEGRRVAIEVSDKGFEPDKVEAKAGEHLTLVFTRTTTSECGAEVMLKATGEKKELPLKQPVELAVHAEKAGEIAFACGMDMMQGTIVVQ